MINLVFRKVASMCIPAREVYSPLNCVSKNFRRLRILKFTGCIKMQIPLFSYRNLKI